MNKIEHIGIAVAHMDTAVDLYQKLLNTPVYKTETIASEQVKTAFLQCGPNKIELLEALSAESPIAKFLEKKGEGIHHIAFEVDDIVAEMARLKSEGFVLLSDDPKQGADNKLVCFVHPKTAGGVLVELCQSIFVKDVLKKYNVQFLEKIFFDKPRSSMESDSGMLNQLITDFNGVSDIMDFINYINDTLHGTPTKGSFISESMVVLEISKDVTKFYNDPEYSELDRPEFVIPTLDLKHIAISWMEYLKKHLR